MDNNSLNINNGQNPIQSSQAQIPATPESQLNNEYDQDEDSPDEERTSNAKGPVKRAGRRKINIEFIKDKSRRHITFSKRKAGIMKKAYELSTLTGTQVLLLVASETGHVYTFATPKLQPLITKTEGKNLIQACLNAPDPTPEQQQQFHSQHQQQYQQHMTFNTHSSNSGANSDESESPTPGPSHYHEQIEDTREPKRIKSEMKYNPQQQMIQQQQMPISHQQFSSQMQTQQPPLPYANLPIDMSNASNTNNYHQTGMSQQSTGGGGMPYGRNQNLNFLVQTQQQNPHQVNWNSQPQQYQHMQSNPSSQMYQGSHKVTIANSQNAQFDSQTPLNFSQQHQNFDKQHMQ